MRFPLLFMLTMTATGALAQDFQLVRSDMVRFYAQENGIMHGIRIDSVAVENGDSVLLNYLTVRTGPASMGSCYYVNAVSMIGRKVVMRPDGGTLLFNRWGDTLTVLTQASLQDNWTLMAIGTDTLLRATVSDVNQQEWLGISDMVKTVTIQAVNGSGQTIVHPANGSEVLIGQQLGLLSGFDLFYFPYSEDFQYASYDVKGMEEFGVGVRRVSTAELYDLELCDEFHFHRSVESSGNGPPDDTYTEQTVISKSISNDSVTYQFETHGCRYHYEYNGWANDPPYTQVITPIEPSIITRRYPFKWDGHEVLMPNELVIVSHDSVVSDLGTEHNYTVRDIPHHGLFEGRPAVTYYGSPFGDWTINGYVFIDQGYCDHDCGCIGHFGPNFDSDVAALGLGQVSYSSGNFYDWNNWNRNATSLVYFNKCGEEWGDPIPEGLLTGVADMARRQPLKVHPNPTTSVLRFDTPSPAAYSVTDAVGRTVMHGRAQQGQNTLSVDGLPEGIYVLRLGDGSGAARFVRAGW